MTGRAATVTLVAACALCACGEAPPAPAAPACGLDDFVPATAWGAPARVTFDERGVSDEVTVAAGFVALTLDDPARCVQVETARVGSRPLVEAGSRGAFCTGCSLRQSVGVGGALFPFPPAPLWGEGPFAVTFGLRDCATWTPAVRGDAALGGSLRLIAARGSIAPEPRAVLRVDVASFGDVWTRSPGAPEALLRAATAELSDARVTLRLAARCALPAPADALLVEDHAHDEVARWTALARARCPAMEPAENDPRATLLVVPCARQRERISGITGPVDGYTTHTPGGALAREVPDAVVLSAGCGATLPEIDGAPLGLGRVLAHELGHLLGLYHVREADDVEDAIGDTHTDDNLMNRRPTLAGARGLTPQQAEVARRHPWLRWPRPASTRCADP